LFGDREPDLRRALPGSIGHYDLWRVVHPDLKTSARVRALLNYLIDAVEREDARISGQVRTRRARGSPPQAMSGGKRAICHPKEQLRQRALSWSKLLCHDEPP
jgi:hypothetical protein